MDIATKSFWIHQNLGKKPATETSKAVPLRYVCAPVPLRECFSVFPSHEYQITLASYKIPLLCPFFMVALLSILFYTVKLSSNAD